MKNMTEESAKERARVESRTAPGASVFVFEYDCKQSETAPDGKTYAVTIRPQHPADYPQGRRIATFMNGEELSEG